MGISTLSANLGIYPTKAYNAVYSQTNTATSTYFTLLNVTAGKGVVSRIATAVYYGGTYYSNVYLKIRITVDSGTAYVIDGTSSGNTNYLRGFLATNARNSGDILLYNSPIYFTKSVLIEVLQNASNNLNTFDASVDYSLV